MRNHKLVHSVVEKMLLYNHQFYIDDINELSTSRQYNNNINNCLSHMANVLTTHLNSNNGFNNSLVASLKSYIYIILDNVNGIDCCNKLICE